MMCYAWCAIRSNEEVPIIGSGSEACNPEGPITVNNETGFEMLLIYNFIEGSWPAWV